MVKPVWIAAVLSAIAIAAIGFGVWLYRPMIVVGAGYKAKILCSGVFVSKRPEADVLAEDLYVDGFEALGLFSSSVDRKLRTATASLLGFWKRVAVYREGLGCTLAVGVSEGTLRSEEVPADVRKDITLSSSVPWPQGSRVELTDDIANVDTAKLKAAMDFAFSEPNPDALQRTRAIVVVHAGRIVAERYSEGVDKTMALLGWSMSKSVLNALVGIAMADPEVARQLQKPLALSNAGLLPVWQNDERSRISLNNLLQMSSGLKFDENYADYEGDVLRMLFAVGGRGEFAAGQVAVAAPGTKWDYSSGTSNIVSYILRRRFLDKSDYLALPNRHLFAPLGMRSAVFEVDASGTRTASSFMYASARDWARLGLLYLRQGDWFGKQILPRGWVARSLEPAMSAPDQLYGLHLWLKLPDRPGLGEPPLPKDSFYMLGHDGQIVAMVPSRDLVIVRMGLARKDGSWRPELILGSIVAAFPDSR